MITNSGKDIIAKYMLGHVSSYASHIAIGCGPTPLDDLEDPTTYAGSYETKQDLDFEMFRVPISSRGYVKENDLTYVVFTAELPTTERYGITEVGIYSAGSNPEAELSGSKMLYSFSQTENWEYHTQTDASDIPIVSAALDNGDNYIFPLDVEGNETGYSAFQISSDNPTMLYSDRIARHEVPRFLDSSIVLRGDSSVINVNASNNLIADDTQSAHIHLTGTSLTLDQNAPSDELRFAFSLINRYGQDPAEDPIDIDEPEEVRVLVEFISSEAGDAQSASLEIRLINGVDGIDFGTNRYFVISKQLEELRKTIGFSWDQVTIVKAYASVLYGIDAAPSDQFYIAFDGLRLENVTDVSPIYALTGYSVVKNTNGIPIIKAANSSSFAEFRFAFELNQYGLLS